MRMSVVCKTKPLYVKRRMLRKPEGEWLRWTPHPVILTIRDNRDYIRVLLYSYSTTITGRGVLLRNGLSPKLRKAEESSQQACPRSLNPLSSRESRANGSWTCL